MGTESDETLLGSRVTELIERGLERYTNGDMEGALSDWEHAMVLDPECVRARNYADYVRNYLAPGADGRGRVLASPAIELDVPFGVELVGAKTEMDLDPYEAVEMDRGTNGRYGGTGRRSEPHQRFDTSEDTTAAYSRKGYHPESDKQTVKIQRETMESERETPWRPGAIDDGWAFDSAPTKAYGRDGGGPAPSPTAAPTRPDSSGELASAIEDVTAGLMAIQDSVPAQLAATGRLRIPGDGSEEAVRTHAGDSDPTLRRPMADYDALDLGDDFDRDMGEVAEPPSSVAAVAEPEQDDPIELEPPRAGGDAVVAVVDVVDDDDELELDVVDSVPPAPVRPEDASEDQSAIRPGQRLVFARERPPPAVQISFRDPDRARPIETSAAAPDPLDNLDLDGLEDELAQPAPDDLALRNRAPTKDPSIASAGITVDESLLQFDPPTAEHASQGKRPGADARAESEDSEAGRSTLDLKRAREARHDVGLYDDIAGDILNELESGPSNETRDERTRRRVAALIDRAASENRDGDHARAVIALDLALQEDPESAVAQKVIHRHRDLLLDIYKNYFGNLNQIPALAVPMHELKLHEINHRAAFLLSRIDGVLSLEDILDICGMSRLEAFRHLARLMLQGILEIR